VKTLIKNGLGRKPEASNKKYMKEYFTNLVNKLFLGTCCVSQHHVNNSRKEQKKRLVSETPSAAMVDGLGWMATIQRTVQKKKSSFK